MSKNRINDHGFKFNAYPKYDLSLCQAMDQ